MFVSESSPNVEENPVRQRFKESRKPVDVLSTHWESDSGQSQAEQKVYWDILEMLLTWSSRYKRQTQKVCSNQW